MKKFLLPVALFILISTFASAEVISFSLSNQSYSTREFERNEYDWFINPQYFELVRPNTLIFSLDASDVQFNSISKKGFRGAFSWKLGGLTAVTAVNYATASTSKSTSKQDALTVTRSNFDVTTGTYDTITESVNIAPEKNGNILDHDLDFHFGAGLGGLGLALQARLILSQVRADSLSYTNEYTNASALSDQTLSERGDRRTIHTDLYYDKTNILALEPEVGFTVGNFWVKATIGFSAENMLLSPDVFTDTTARFNEGATAPNLSPIRQDEVQIQSYEGVYCRTDGGVYTPTPFFLMDTSGPSDKVPDFLISAGASSDLDLGSDLVLPLSVQYSTQLYPELSFKDRTETTYYNDALETPAEYRYYSNTTTTELKVDYDRSVNLSGGIKKTFKPTGDASFHLGALLDLTASFYRGTKTQTRDIMNKIDNDADGNYTSAGDVDTRYSESGYEIRTSRNAFTVALNVPIAASYRPVKKLTFHAGTKTGLSVPITSLSTSTSGSGTFLYEKYTDNNNSGNNYAKRQKDGTTNATTPSSSFDIGFQFGNSSTFGFTLQMTDNFKIDTLAQTSRLSFQSFAVTGIYSF